jgi:tetratricopeptide (TPR) repeat protein
MNGYGGLINYLNNVYNIYHNEFIGKIALYFSACTYNKINDYNSAISCFQEAVETFQDISGADEETAWIMFELAQLYETLSEINECSGNYTIASTFFDNAYDIYMEILNNYSNTEVGGLLRFLYGDGFFTKETFAKVPDKFALYPAYPNPFNPTTIIHYAIPEAQKVKITIYDITGKEVKALVNDVKPAGYYTVEWNSTNNYGLSVASGVYFYDMRTEQFSKTGKMLLVR